MAVKLSSYQLKAIDELRSGSILCGGVGSGKSRTALAYYVLRICNGRVKINGVGLTKEMNEPRDLYIITTAKKRDSGEWYEECSNFLLFKDSINSLSHVRVIVDSWNNIKKYQNVFGAFFIFDEQRIVGRGAWVKAFLNIARKNQWILLTATPADTYSDLIPVFVANGFYKNRTDFNNQHVIFSPYSKYPKIERYVGIKKLDTLRDRILIKMEDRRHTVRHNEYVTVDYDKNLYRTVMRDRWNPYDNCPIEENGKLLYLLRRVCFGDMSRIKAIDRIINDKSCCIVFYNFTYELNMLREYAREHEIKWKEWNGEKHQDLPKGSKWMYLVQYTAGCEGWNCVTTDTIILFSQTYSYRMLEQACGRIDRMNTPFTDLYYYHLRSNAPIDLAIWRKLKNKQNFNERAFLKSGK